MKERCKVYGVRFRVTIYLIPYTLPPIPSFYYINFELFIYAFYFEPFIAKS
jgi:hypothetical protein